MHGIMPLEISNVYGEVTLTRNAFTRPLEQPGAAKITTFLPGHLPRPRQQILPERGLAIPSIFAVSCAKLQTGSVQKASSRLHLLTTSMLVPCTPTFAL
eukprot:scaffold147553_cov37-Prasinocladus_malaysianus.AAC.1